jgi:hypothetical protein
VSSSTGRGAPWWKIALEDGSLVAVEPEEPWAERELDDGDCDGLSDDQRKLLAGLTDQPAIPRLRALPDHPPTGS